MYSLIAPVKKAMGSCWWPGGESSSLAFLNETLGEHLLSAIFTILTLCNFPVMLKICSVYSVWLKHWFVFLFVAVYSGRWEFSVYSEVILAPVPSELLHGLITVRNRFVSESTAGSEPTMMYSIFRVAGNIYFSARLTLEVQTEQKCCIKVF